MIRCELMDFERKAIDPHLPKAPRSFARVDDRRVFDGVFHLAFWRAFECFAGAAWPARLAI
jgi:hypothetical protein